MFNINRLRYLNFFEFSVHTFQLSFDRFFFIGNVVKLKLILITNMILPHFIELFVHREELFVEDFFDAEI